MTTKPNEFTSVDHASGRSVALAIARQTTREEQQVLLSWTQALLDTRGSSKSKFAKARGALEVTLASPAMLPLLKTLLGELRRVGWDERSWAGRLGLGGAIGTLAIAGNAGAGIAALGGAIGIPLWIVLGAGGLTAGTLVDTLLKSLEAKNLASTDRTEPPKTRS